MATGVAVVVVVGGGGSALPAPLPADSESEAAAAAAAAAEATAAAERRRAAVRRAHQGGVLVEVVVRGEVDRDRLVNVEHLGEVRVRHRERAAARRRWRAPCAMRVLRQRLKEGGGAAAL